MHKCRACCPLCLPNNNEKYVFSWIKQRKSPRERKIWRKADLMQSSEVSCCCCFFFLRWLCDQGVETQNEIKHHTVANLSSRWTRYNFTNAKRLYNCSLWSASFRLFFFTHQFQHSFTLANTEFYCLYFWLEREHCCRLFSHSSHFFLSLLLIFFHRFASSTFFSQLDCIVVAWVMMTYCTRLFGTD